MREDFSQLAIALLCVAAIALIGETILGLAFDHRIGEVAVHLAFFIVVAAAGVLIFWKAIRSLALPLRSIESAIEEFSKGGSAESAEGRLPAEGPMNVKYISGEIGDLMTRVRGWKEELEAEVAHRTFELEFRNALLRSIGSSEVDAEAYAAVGEVIRSFFSADRVLFAYYDGSRTLVSIVAPPPPSARSAEGGAGRIAPVPLSPDEAELLEAAAGGAAIEAAPLGFLEGTPLVLGLEAHGEVVGYAAMARESGPLSASERKVLGEVFAAFAIQVRMRKESTRRELVRMEAELALRRSEERLRSFFEESKDMIYSSNAEDVVAAINAAGLALLGLEDRFEVVGQPMSKHVMSVEDRRFFMYKLEAQGFVVDYECVFRKKDGTMVFCLESAYALRDREGRLLEIQGIVKDISERIASERELWKSNLELVEANAKLKSTQMLMVQHEKLASIGQLAAGIAHEINNPLGFLKSNQGTLEGYLRTMREAWEEAAAALPEKSAEIAERLDLGYIFAETQALLAESDDGYERIIDIVKNLKSFARIDAEPTMAPYDLNKGIESCLVVARNEYKYCAEVELSLGELPPIKASGGEINQVVLNMIVNAAQAIESQKRGGKGRILIATRLAGDRAVFEIEDDGPGIPEDKRLKVFDPFYTTKEPGKGTGLGLSISYDIVVRKHGGALTVHDSRLGGVLFRVALPVARAAAGPEPPAAPGEEPGL